MHKKRCEALLTHVYLIRKSCQAPQYRIHSTWIYTHIGNVSQNYWNFHKNKILKYQLKILNINILTSLREICSFKHLIPIWKLLRSIMLKYSFNFNIKQGSESQIPIEKTTSNFLPLYEIPTKIMHSLDTNLK